jgi:2-keto-4-pentenoate hydratase
VSERADSLARVLAERHARRDVFTSIFEEGEPADVPLAYQVQEAFVAGLGGTPVGSKVGLTTQRMQQMCGVNEPISGVVLASRVLRSPTAVKASDYVRLGVESEMAVRIALGAGQVGAGRTGLELQDLPLHHLIDQVCAAFELVEDSLA